MSENSNSHSRLKVDEFEKIKHNISMAKTIIALVDCDNFFVSCEQALHPELVGKPVCVLSNNDGCVISRSREAKALGIKMGMPYFMAKNDFPSAIFVSCNHDVYEEFSNRTMNILRDFSPDVEVYSIDEAFVDLTGLRRLYRSNYLEIAKKIQKRIKEEVNIGVSIGISSSKTLAKLASDKSKNIGGFYMIGARKIKKELISTPVEDIWGIGANTAALFNKWGVLNAYEVVCQTDMWLKTKIGIKGVELKHELMGEVVSKVVSKSENPKSIQKTSSFGSFTSDENYIKNSLNYHIHRACMKLRKLNGRCSSVSIILRTKDFKIFSEKRVLLNPTDFEFELSSVVLELFEKIYNPKIIYRSSGIILDRLSFGDEQQLFLFSEEKVDEKKHKLAQSIDRIEQKFGKNAIKTGFCDSNIRKHQF